MSAPAREQEPSNSHASSGSSGSSATPATPAPRSSLDASSPSSRNPSLRIPSMPSAAAQHRQSFHELRGAPPSPRSQRQSSISQLAVQELIDNPPMRNAPDPRFAGRNWTAIKAKELVNPEDLRWVDIDTGVEEATNLLISSGAPVILIREGPSNTPLGTFDYRDLNAYLLMVIGLTRPDEDHMDDFMKLAGKVREGKPIPVRDIMDLIGKKEPLTFLDENADLMKAIETFGRGVHRAVVVDSQTDEVTGVLSQSRLVRFLWENGRSFPVLDQLYSMHLRDLKIGSNDVIAINGDRPLHAALTLLNTSGVSSLPVVDASSSVIGNISNVDVKLLTKSSSLPLLSNTCIHFISVILSTRGMFEGKDSFPVFHVTPMSTLAHTVAKLVATRSHRMWITEPVSPSSSSGPPTPSLHTATLVPTSSHSSSLSAGSGQHHIVPPAAASTPSDPFPVADASPKTPFIAPSGPSVSATALPGQRISGTLVGVVSLTDILMLFAKAGGVGSGVDPSEIRMRRRRSSSSSIGLGIGASHRASLDSVRGRGTGDTARKGSAGGGANNGG